MQRPPRRPLGGLNIKSLQQHALTAVSEQAQEGGPDDGRDYQRLIREFEAVLEEDVHLNADERETILRQYADALHQVPVEIGPPDIDGLKRNFSQAIETMIADNALSPAERDSLERQMQESLRAVESPEVLRANEYARRLREDGLSEANAWLASDGADVAQSTADDVLASGGVPLGTSPPARRRRRI